MLTGSRFNVDGSRRRLGGLLWGGRRGWVDRVWASTFCRRSVREPRDRRTRPSTTTSLVPFPLHSTILEPDLDLSLGELQRGRHLDASRSTQIAAEVELLLQLDQLRIGVRRAWTLWTGAAFDHCTSGSTADRVLRWRICVHLVIVWNTLTDIYIFIHLP